MDYTWILKYRLLPLPKLNNNILAQHELALPSGDIVNDDFQHRRVSEPKPLCHCIGHGINRILIAQYAKKRAKKIGIPYKPTTRSKMRLTPSERSKIASHFRRAKQAFEETQNKPHRGDIFYMTRGHGLVWSGHEARQSIFQHYLAANARPDSYVQPKVFRNDAYRPDHAHAGQYPVPHLQIIDPTTNKQQTKLTMEYPLVPIGYNEGGLPGAYEVGSKGPARTLVSCVEGVNRFEGVISHDSVDPYNHYLARQVFYI